MSDTGPTIVGVIPGEGIGPEVMASAIEVLDAVACAGHRPLQVRRGGHIGREAEREHGSALSAEVGDFCRDVFADGGAVLCGPGGGRFVYDLRRKFDLFFKISPLCVANGAPDASCVRADRLRDVDILIVRENCGGVYQGAWGETDRDEATRERGAFHRFEYSEEQVRRFLVPAARLAQSRAGHLTVVWKEAGVPSVSELWRRVATHVAAAQSVSLSMVDVDLMAYRLIQNASSFDVVAAPNLFGDILADLGGALVGSRAMTYSGNYAATGAAVYQTNHGAAFDLVGTGRANPVGQILSAAMMLRESHGRWREADAIEAAVREVLTEGWRTPDIAVAGCRVTTTRELGRRIAARAAARLSPEAESSARRSDG